MLRVGDFECHAKMAGVFTVHAFHTVVPVRGASEMKLMYDSIGFVKQVEMYYVHMPNVLNFAFDYSWFLYLLLITYPFMFTQLYFYMFHQRRRKLKMKKA